MPGKCRNISGEARFSRTLEVKSQRSVILLELWEPLKDFSREIRMARFIPQNDQSGSSKENGPEGYGIGHRKTHCRAYSHPVDK